MKDISAKIAAKDILGRGLSKNDFTDLNLSKLDNTSAVHSAYNFIHDLKFARRSLNVIIAGDSTSTISGGSEDAKGGLTYQFFQKLAPYFPARSFLYRPGFSMPSGSFSGTETIQTGTGGLNCVVYNAGVSGSTPTYLWGGQNVGNGYYNSTLNLENSADLIIWDFGFNMSSFTPRNLTSIVSQMYASLSQLMAFHPKAGVIIIEQWPIYGNLNGDIGSRACRELCKLVNGTLVETENKFISANKPIEWYKTGAVNGEVHLSKLGAGLVSQWMLDHLINSTTQKPINSISISQSAENLLLNGRFDTFSSGDLTNYTSTNATITENTTDFLTGSRSINLTIGTNTASYIEQQITNVGVLKRLSRKSITVSCDIRLPATGNNNRLAVIGISYNGVEVLGQASYSSVSNLVDIGGYGWTKKALTFQLPEITNLSLPIVIRFYAQESAGTPSGAGLIVGLDNLKLDLGDRPFGF